MLLSLRSGVPSRSNSRHRQSMACLLPGWGIIPYPDKEGKAGFSGRRSGSGHRCAGSSFSSVSCAVCAAMQERLSPPAPAGDKANRSPARALPPCAFRPLRRPPLAVPAPGGARCGRPALSECLGFMFSVSGQAKSRPFGRLLAWQGQKDLNPRHSVLETDALPTELYPYI